MAESERTEARYDVQEVEMGQVYTWRPESVVVECGCGERPTLIASNTACDGCGADHAAAREGLDGGVLGEEAAHHPWRHAENRQDGGLPY